MRYLAGVLAVIVVAVVLSVPAPAFAAFPGANGLLAVQPRAGSGIVLVAANGKSERRVCPAGSRCARAEHPTWSPDGRALMFTDPAIRIIYPDGSCLDCGFGAAPNPAFKPAGTEISFVQNGGVTVDGIDGIRKPSPGVSGASDAVWSAGGSVAVVRRGVIWAGAPGRLKKLGAGVEPSWAPSGNEIAAVEHGWLVIMRLRDNRVRRLVRGTAPAFSPDGRAIAFVGADHRLMIVAADTPHPTIARIGNVQAVSVDWQPKPRGTNPGCNVPTGSMLMESSPSAVVTDDTGATSADAVSGPSAVMGCLRADGRERLLESLPAGNIDTAESAAAGALSAPYAALVNSDTDEHYGGTESTIEVFDLRTGASVPGLGGESAGCEDVCLGENLNDIVLSSDGASAAHIENVVAPGILSSALIGLGCAPGGTACAAIDLRQAFDSADPSGGSAAWTPTPLSGQAAAGLSFPQGVACPSTSLCVAVGISVVWTMDSAGTWTPPDLAGEPALNAVTCPTSSFCLATGNRGDVAISTDPAAGASSWSAGTIHGATFLGAPACSPDGTCSVSDGQHVYTSTDPTGGASTWSLDTSTAPYRSESCPTDGLCVALNSNPDQITTSTAPGAAPQTETPVATALTSVSCPSASFCAAIGPSGTLETSTDPEAGSWTQTTIDQGRELEAIVCPSASDCLATDTTGHILNTSDPTAGTPAWTPALVDGNPCNDTTDCSVEQIQASDGHGVQTVASTTISGSGPYLTELTFSGNVLSWNQDGTQHSVTLTP